jgi:hypothetical protein
MFNVPVRLTSIDGLGTSAPYPFHGDMLTTGQGQTGAADAFEARTWERCAANSNTAYPAR